MTRRQRLIAIFVVEVAFVVVHVLLREPAELISAPIVTWHLTLVLAGAALLSGYAYSIRCPTIGCRAHQVIRGWSFSDLRLPGERCYKCGSAL
jgi:hypothetical protein